MVSNLARYEKLSLLTPAFFYRCNQKRSHIYTSPHAAIDRTDTLKHSLMSHETACVILSLSCTKVLQLT